MLLFSSPSLLPGCRLPLSLSLCFLLHFTVPLHTFFLFLFFSSISFTPPLSSAPFFISYSLFFVSYSFSVLTHTPVHTYIHSYIPHLTVPATCAMRGDLTQANVLLLALLPSSCVSQSSQEWHSEDLRTRQGCTAFHLNGRKKCYRQPASVMRKTLKGTVARGLSYIMGSFVCTVYIYTIL